MPLIQAIILGLVQGLAEFIPISSSGHLVAVSQLLGWEAPAVAFDTILHLGTLLAVLIYFWREWRRLLVVGGRLLAGVFFPSQREKINRPDAKLLGLLIMGTVPALVVGYLFRDQFEKLFESLWFVTLFSLLRRFCWPRWNYFCAGATPGALTGQFGTSLLGVALPSSECSRHWRFYPASRVPA